MTRRCWCNRPVAKDVLDAIWCGNHDDAPPRIFIRRFMDMDAYDPSPEPIQRRIA